MMNLFNFPSSNKVLGLGRSIFVKNVSPLLRLPCVKIPAHRDIPLIFLRFGLGYNTDNGRFSKFIVSNIILNKTQI
jgi:hypothetical protein